MATLTLTLVEQERKAERLCPAGQVWAYCRGCNEQKAMSLNHPDVYHAMMCKRLPVYDPEECGCNQPVGAYGRATYRIIGHHEGIKCLLCGAVSLHKSDVEGLKCPRCHGLHLRE